MIYEYDNSYLGLGLFKSEGRLCRRFEALQKIANFTIIFFQTCWDTL